MKKLMCLFALMAMMLTFSACENSTIKELKQEIEKVNKACPQNMGLMGDMMSAKYNDDTKTAEFYYITNDEFVDIDLLRKNKDMVRLSFKSLLNDNSEFSKAMKLASDAGVGLKYTFKSKDTGKSVDVVLTSEDIKKALNEPVYEEATYELQLKTMIENENSTYPQDLGSGLTMQSVKLTDDYVVYLCYMDEDIFDMSMIDEETKEAMKDGIIGMMDDITIKTQLKIFVKNGKGLVYRYQGDESGKTVDIIFSVDELKQHL